ncbi:hypothetical protein Rleg4DRAFT_3134 [Rhizobium leguminosarum bv. trifolii WSM2297]|uniref:Uncharacterized protein n=1 Tax=Rhizobium leguminosarum bv. trifolii WSM2297 TaxID=754762 RepID=J0KUU6_RHILT|nr:hypothetical protein [Rhizobium leguminosarum]EJC81454.1 hypothetical protein Rleg4DRAFT_3134 [Rhizobium leguminosarum bv. trifolii WSM2297]
MTYNKLLFVLGLAGVLTFSDFRVEGQGSMPLSVGFATPAGAVIGRPLTPLSYAGVARRTTRRVVTRTATTIAVLPSGCLYGSYYGGYYYRCGGLYYAKSGSVYVQVIVQ